MSSYYETNVTKAGLDKSIFHYFMFMYSCFSTFVNQIASVFVRVHKAKKIPNFCQYSKSTVK